MRLARHAPLVLGALLVARVVACGGDKPGTGGTPGGGGQTSGGTGGAAGSGGRGGQAGTSGTGGTGGNESVASAACVNGDIQYGGGEIVGGDAGSRQTHVCPNHDCWIDAATGSASCLTTDQAGTPPFRTCQTVADCSGATYCSSWGSNSQAVLGAPACSRGVCEWTSQMEMVCPTGYTCLQYFCTFSGAGGGAGNLGTTSGGFPWTGGGGTCGGSSPCNGRGGNGGGGGGGSGGADGRSPGDAAAAGD